MMTISQSLQQFYIENNFSSDGGKNDDYFDLKFKLFTIKIPNSQFRKDVIYLHDIQHILYNCDTSWRGEAFIAGWEIGTKMWKHFPIGMISLWAMGFSLLNYPKEVFKGYKTGINSIGIIDLKLDKKAILKLSITELKKIIKKEKTKKLNWFSFLFWCLISEIIFLFPFLILAIFLINIF
ncbi:hypothetical protein [uncultured Polaribacter sp.]|uniref:hypothetical protein n=1 Tax=uncultured Polaribacter sp. TaxID=174711 RepID=UPI00261CEB18|nr:hypothetical protein [uncultured Polaribacter sp.]